jgi:hypothetical protein
MWPATSTQSSCMTALADSVTGSVSSIDFLSVVLSL